MTPAERARQHRARRRAGQRIYPVPIADRDLCAMIEAGVITDVAALSRASVAAAIAEIVQTALAEKFRHP